MTSFKRLMEPLSIKSTVLPNRLVFPPTVTNFAEDNGEVGEPLTDYYRTITRSRVGLNVIGATSICPEGNLLSYCTRICQDSYIEGLTRLFSVIKAGGSVPGIQLAHAGRQTSSEVTGMQPVAPSPIPCPTKNETPRELTIGEIENIEDQFAQGANRAKQAGAEVIELHGAHGYLINQFLSPHTNKRNDVYGGNTENRSRFFVNILTKTREKVGADLPIICRISADEYVSDGLTLEESKEIAVMLMEKGLDVISVSGGIAESREERDKAMKKGGFLELARGIKEAVHIPVIAVGKIIDLSQAEKILEDGAADLVAICRALIADPELIQKTMAGNDHEIRRCIGCDECHATLRKKDKRMRCSVNKAWGRQWEVPVQDV